MTFNNSVPANSHGTPSYILIIGDGVLAAWNLALAALLWAMIISVVTFLVNIVAALILGLTSGMLDLSGNSLSSLSIVILLEVSEKAICSTCKRDWSTILKPPKDWTRGEIERLLEDQEDFEEQLKYQDTLHLDQAAEIADLAAVPRAIVRDRVKRYRTILKIQRRITKIRLRRLLYFRAAAYFEMLEERKRGQRIRSRDLWLTICINALLHQPLGLRRGVLFYLGYHTIF